MWQQDTPTRFETRVYFSHIMQDSLAADYVVEFTSRLQARSAYFCCAVSINSQQKRDGATEVTVLTGLPRDEVDALIVRLKQKYGDFTALARHVQSQAVMTISGAT